MKLRGIIYTMTIGGVARKVVVTPYQRRDLWEMDEETRLNNVRSLFVHDALMRHEKPTPQEYANITRSEITH